MISCRHEIVGIVVEVGENAVGHFKVGDRAGVGCLVRSDRTCELCQIGNEEYCPRMVLTYSSMDWGDGDAITCGGYSNKIVVDHR